MVELRKLRDSQLEAYDADFIAGAWWHGLEADLRSRLSSVEPRVLDLGGGSGRFADRLLGLFPDARVTIVDSSELLLSRNTPHPAKTIVCAPIEQLPANISQATFDLVCLHFVLHHLVAGTYRASREAQVAALRRVSGLLAPDGVVSVFEDVFEGPIIDALPSRLIHALSSSRVLAPLMRRLGGTPAGVGVGFLSEREWLRTFDQANLRVTGRRRYYGSMRLRWPVRAVLHARSDVCHYWLTPEDEALAGTRRRKPGRGRC